MPLDTLSNVKARLGISSSADDTLLGLLQNSADALIAAYTQRDFTGGSFTEYHPGNAELVLLKNYPVTTVTSVKVDASHGFAAETTMPSDQYVVHFERGVIQSLCGPFLPRRIGGLAGSNLQVWTRGPRTVQVVYSASTDVPNDVKEAYALLMSAWYRKIKTEVAANFQEVRQQKFGDTFVIYGSPTSTAIPPEVEAILAAHRVPNL